MHSQVTVDLSAIIPVGERRSDAARLYREYRDALASTGLAFEMIYVLDGHYPEYQQVLERFVDAGDPVRVVLLTRGFGEATAVAAGFELARGEKILTLPAHAQVKAGAIPQLVNQLRESDLAICRRWPRVGGVLERFRRAAFHGLLSRVTKLRFSDLGCSARAMHRRVLEEIELYGDQQRFLPVLADRQGFRVREIEVPQHEEDRNSRVYGPRSYAQGFLDIFTVFFLVRFTKKPLRFFGMIGVVTFSIGLLAMLYMIFERLFLGQALANRPAFLVATLFIVLGLQVFALGLLGELIIFVHAGQTKDYQIDRVIQFPDAGAATADPAAIDAGGRPAA